MKLLMTTCLAASLISGTILADNHVLSLDAVGEYELDRADVRECMAQRDGRGQRIICAVEGQQRNGLLGVGSDELYANSRDDRERALAAA